MKEYEIEIEEKLTKTVRVVAENLDDAFDIVKKQYKDGDIVLSADDFKEVEFTGSIQL